MIGGGPSLCSSTMVNSNIYLLILIPTFQCLAWLGGYSFHYRTNGEPMRSVVESVRLITEVMYGLVKEGNISALPLPCGSINNFQPN